MVLPSLSWKQSAFFSTGSTSPTNQQVVDCIDTIMSSSTYWETKSKSTDYIEVGPKAGSAIPNFRAIISGDPGASAVQSPDTSAAGIWVGIAPNGGTLGTWNSATPYGANRFSKYWKACANAVTETIYIVESSEVLAVVFKDDSVANKYFCTIFGAILTPPDAGSAEQDGRIYGIITSGSSNIITEFLNNDSEFTGHTNANGGDHIGIFNPISTSIWETIERATSTFLVDNGSSRVSLGGSYVTFPIFYHCDSGTDYFAGMLRQIRVGGMLSNRQILQDGQGGQKGVVFSPTDNPSSNDSIVFCEG